MQNKKKIMKKILRDLILLAKAKVNNVDAKAQVSIKMLPEYTRIFLKINANFLNMLFFTIMHLKTSIP